MTKATLWAGASALIDGRWEAGEGEDLLPIVNPATGSTMCSVRTASTGQAERAVAAAHRAFTDGPWTRMSPRERSMHMYRLVEAVADARDDLIETVIDEVGSPITLARGLQVGMPIDCLGWYAERARVGPPGGWERALPPHHDPVTTSSLLVHEPAGVVAALTAYNYPLNLLAWKLGAALAAGCPMVVMPSPRGTLSTIAFFRAIEQADLPPGLVNLVAGGPEIGKLLSSHRNVAVVSFTGSVGVGAAVMAQAAPGIHKVVLELGGKSPNIITPGARLDEASIRPSLLRFTRNAGQGCGATTRIFVQRDDYDEFLDVAGRLLASLHVGDPWDERTVIGPLISAEHRDRVEAYVDRAVAAGATVVAGGGRPSDQPTGFFINPALVANVSNDDEICQEELFAPIAAVLPYDDLDEAIHLANSTPFGLNANVVGPTTEALAVARRIRAGTVTLNGGGGMRPDAPWGGYGLSGLGRELGTEGLLEFLELKHIQWPLDGT